MKAIVLIAAILAAPVQASAYQPAAEPPTPSTDELTVIPHAECLEPKRDPLTPLPHVVSTFPAHGETVRPGLLYLRVTFDEPMSCKGFFLRMGRLRAPCNQDRQIWLLSFDRKTIRTLCHVEPNSQYGVRMSNDPPTAQLISLAGRPLDPYEFTFMTSSAPEVTSTSDAIGEDVEMLPPKQDEPIPLQEFRGKR
ncbi:MAG: hypothetical protein JSR98_05000 [Proteobacteria bacterium]|nr:hypothetical protein [Pseudomonadota bacterium]